MELGDKVCVYKHEKSDDRHYSTDQLGFVVGFGGEGVIDVVVFPPGGPIRYERVELFYDDSLPYRWYWRELGSPAPDFASVFDPPAEEAPE